jgi:phosphohistidine phosphatase
MTRNLFVLRHAKSSWADEYTDDWERPLTERGERDAVQVGRLLHHRALVPDLMVSSDAVRAESTARRVADAAGYTDKVVLSSRLYHARPDVMIDVLKDAPPTAQRVLIVAHNPGLEDLVVQLTGEHVGLSTATLVHIELPIGCWSDLRMPGGGSVIEFWNPRAS